MKVTHILVLLQSSISNKPKIIKLIWPNALNFYLVFSNRFIHVVADYNQFKKDCLLMPDTYGARNIRSSFKMHKNNLVFLSF